MAVILGPFVILLLLMYIACFVAPIFVLPFINYLFLQNAQEDKGKLKGYFLFKSLLIFQPTIIIISLFGLSIVGWKMIHALSPYVSEGNLIIIRIFSCILGVGGLFFILAFIKKQLFKMYCLKLDTHSLLRDIATDMTKQGFTLVYPIVYFAFIFVAPRYAGFGFYL